MVTGTMFARAIGFLFPVLLTHWESRPAFGLIYFFIGAGFLVAEFSTSTFPVAMITLAARDRNTTSPWPLVRGSGTGFDPGRARRRGVRRVSLLLPQERRQA